MANILSAAKRTEVVSLLVEGMSMRATSRVTGVARQTINDLLLDIGAVCAKYQYATLRNLNCKRMEADEIWSFIHCKRKTVPFATKAPAIAGDIWTWVAVDVDSKLVPCWFVGERDRGAATLFLTDLASRLAGRIQLTSDGLGAYLDAVETAFGGDVDFAQVVKEYGNTQESEAAHHRYSPGHCTSIEKKPVCGNPDMNLAGTSYVERGNLSMRMGMRRFTRLTNGFSKRAAQHEAMIALYFMHYNFVRIHQTTSLTPAMAAGVTDRLWEVEDIVALLNAESATVPAAA